MRRDPEAPECDLPLHDLHPPQSDMHSEVMEGLSSIPKTLPSKYFYDTKGSRLFDRICELDDYYLTRTEIAILEREVNAIATRLGERVLLIELGSGSSTKTGVLLQALKHPSGYVPVDISKVHLQMAAARIGRAFPDIQVHPVCADFTGDLSLPAVDDSAEARFVFFPGSTIGNFDAAGQRDLLERIAVLCQPQGGGLLIGIDLVKDVVTLEAAYNDREGVTANFNLNLLERINRDLDADFDTSNFRHQAIFNPEENRIEMYLISKCEQWVSIGAWSCRIARDEVICTEYSHKFSVEGFTALAAEVGFTLDACWTDERKLFAILLLRVKDWPPASQSAE